VAANALAASIHALAAVTVKPMPSVTNPVTQPGGYRQK
jgi:hypothetical protein